MSSEVGAAIESVRHTVLWLGGAQVIVVGLITWLGQLWSKRIIASERAAFETKLANQTHALELKLEGHRLEINSALAHYTARTGLLSELQLKATEQIWAKLFRVQWDVVRRASPLQSVRIDGPGVPNLGEMREAYFKQMHEDLGTLDGARLGLLEVVHERRPFLPKPLFAEMESYNGLLLEAVTLLQNHLEDEHEPNPGEGRAAAVERRKQYRVKRDEILKRLSDQHDEIAALTGPPPPSPPK